MKDLVLTASGDHIKRLAHEADPVKAVTELIWNAIDAEATKVLINLERNSMGAIDIVSLRKTIHLLRVRNMGGARH